MSDAIKDWLPITKRNRVALGFAFAALVMFVTWNFLPYYEYGAMSSNQRVLIIIWFGMVNPDNYLNAIRSTDIDGFLWIAHSTALLLNGILVMVVIPFWKMIHSSEYLKMPLAVANLVGGLMWYSNLYEIFRYKDSDYSTPYLYATYLLIALTMFTLSAALFIFKNELGLRHELEVKKMMGGGDSR